MITVEGSIKIHFILAERFGGITGIRDINLLESALARPYQTFDREDLHKSAIEKAPALIESIITNHPFLDGNKRSGYVFMRMILLEAALDVDATENEKYSFVISVAKGEIRYIDICIWIRNRIRKKL